MDKLKTYFFQVEERKWFRRIESFFTLTPAYFGVCFMLLLKNTELAPLLSYSLWATIIFSPILAYSMWRESRLVHLERMAIPLISLCYSFLILVAV